MVDQEEPEPHPRKRAKLHHEYSHECSNFFLGTSCMYCPTRPWLYDGTSWPKSSTFQNQMLWTHPRILQSEERSFEIYVKDLKGGSHISKVNNSSVADDVKQMYLKITGISPETQILPLSGPRLLEPRRILRTRRNVSCYSFALFGIETNEIA